MKPIVPPRPSPRVPTGPLRVVQASFQGNQLRLPSPAGHPAVVQRSGGASWAPLPDGMLRLRPPGTGERLPPAVQAKMEGLFRTDLSGVRVHVGPEAAALGALAFTHRTDIYFAPGQYAPHSAHGERLLAHELTHVVQQRTGRVRCPAGSGVAVVHDLGLEAEAERMGALVASSARAAPAGPPARIVAPRAQPLQARLAPAPPPRPVAARPSPRILPPPPHRQSQTAAVQPFGLWLARKCLDWTDPHWRERGDLIRRERETRELYEGLWGETKKRPKAKKLLVQLNLIDAAQADPADFIDVGNELGNIAAGLRAEEEMARRLDAASKHFTSKGTSHLASRPDWLAMGIREDVWNRLTSLGSDIPNVKKKARLGEDKALAYLIDYLFQRFITAGFKYHIMQDAPSGLVGAYADTPEGNCIAYAMTFANVLNSFGIEAEAKYIRKESQGRFIVRLDQFIDPTVTGHIYIKKALQAGYYMFTSHAATWVPSRGKYYDPMACASYPSLDPYIECNITSSKDGKEFRPATRPRTLAPHRHWKLVRPEVGPGRGGFSRLQLVEDN